MPRPQRPLSPMTLNAAVIGSSALFNRPCSICFVASVVGQNLSRLAAGCPGTSQMRRRQWQASNWRGRTSIRSTQRPASSPCAIRQKLKAPGIGRNDYESYRNLLRERRSGDKGSLCSPRIIGRCRQGRTQLVSCSEMFSTRQGVSWRNPRKGLIQNDGIRTKELVTPKPLQSPRRMGSKRDQRSENHIPRRERSCRQRHWQGACSKSK